MKKGKIQTNWEAIFSTVNATKNLLSLKKKVKEKN